MAGRNRVFMSSSRALFILLDYFNLDYKHDYLETFNNLDKIYKKSTKNEKLQFFQFILPLHEGINNCFDEFIKCIPASYKTAGWKDYGKFEKILNKKGGFQVKKGFFNAIRSLEKERKDFEEKEWLIDERLMEVINCLLDYIDYVTSEAHFIKAFGEGRLKTNRNISKRIQWKKNVDHFKKEFGKFPRYEDLVEDTYIYNKSTEKWLVSKKYYISRYQLPRRTHSRYRIEYKRDTILHFYKD